MRLEAQAKLGFYPINPRAIDLIAARLTMGTAKPDAKAGHFQLLDPCAGEGAAVKQLADALGFPASRRYAIELDAGRGAKLRETLGPEANVLTPASFMGTRIQSQSFGLAYVNPPFDDELGGGKRQEHTFAAHASRLLKFGGILVLVLPETAMNGKLRDYLDAFYEDAQLFRLPDEIRPFREVVYIGKKRRTDAVDDRSGYLNTLFRRQWDAPPNLPVLGETEHVWTIPPAWTPGFFAKVEMTEEEKVSTVESSPLLKMLEPPKAAARKRPPLPLYKGHVALLLASGMLDGVVEPDGEPPHVVRGTARKVDFLADKTESVNFDTGAVTAKEVWSQRIVLTVRAVTADGTIKTFEDGEAKQPVPPAVEVA